MGWWGGVEREKRNQQEQKTAANGEQTTWCLRGLREWVDGAGCSRFLTAPARGWGGRVRGGGNDARPGRAQRNGIGGGPRGGAVRLLRAACRTHATGGELMTVLRTRVLPARGRAPAPARTTSHYSTHKAFRSPSSNHGWRPPGFLHWECGPDVSSRERC